MNNLKSQADNVADALRKFLDVASKYNLSGKDDIFLKVNDLADSLKDFGEKLEQQEPLYIYKAELITPIVVAAKSEEEARLVIKNACYVDGLVSHYRFIDIVKNYHDLPNEWMADYHKTIPFSRYENDQRTIKKILEDSKK